MSYLKITSKAFRAQRCLSHPFPPCHICQNEVSLREDITQICVQSQCICWVEFRHLGRLKPYRHDYTKYRHTQNVDDNIRFRDINKAPQLCTVQWAVPSEAVKSGSTVATRSSCVRYNGLYRRRWGCLVAHSAECGTVGYTVGCGEVRQHCGHQEHLCAVQWAVPSDAVRPGSTVATRRSRCVGLGGLDHHRGGGRPGQPGGGWRVVMVQTIPWAQVHHHAREK